MAKYCFSGHESFVYNSLWLKNGCDLVVPNRGLNAPDAVRYLDMGKNMVPSIRYWLKVCNIYDENGITWLGDYLFNDRVYMFRECEKYTDITRMTIEDEKGDAYSIDLVTNHGTCLRTQTHVLPDKDKSRSSN
ncbi:MAG: DUF4007 family protein [Bacteroidales bacterium]|nr:DUF4007 family protein [Bacteroidales bacterium]